MVALLLCAISVLAGFGGLVACTPTSSPTSETIVHGSTLAMGTRVTVTLSTSDRDGGAALLRQAFAEVERLEQVFSSYRTDSELSRVNRGAGIKPVPVSTDFIVLTRLAARVADQTGGAFNPLTGPAVKLWGIPEHPHVPSEASRAALRPLMQMDQVVVDEGRQTVWLKMPGMALGYGGIAKGFAADRVQERVRELGALGGIIAIGGDLRVFGTRPDGSPWRVGVRDPDSGAEPLDRIRVTGGVSTSGNYERFFEVDGVRYHHILDPRTLWPARPELAAVTVIAPDAAWADGLATGLFVMGEQAGGRLVAELPHVHALWVRMDGQRIPSAGWPGDARGPVTD